MFPNLENASSSVKSKRNTFMHTERTSQKDNQSQADKLSAAIEQVTNYMISDPMGP